MEIFYRLPEVCDESTYFLSSPNRYESKAPHPRLSELDEFWLEMVAENCAEDYNAYHNWESEWPEVITLHETEEGPEVARFSVSMEMQPHFSGTKVEIEDG